MMRIQLAQRTAEGDAKTLAGWRSWCRTPLRRAPAVDLHPPVLNDGGMVAALEWLARHMREPRTGGETSKAARVELLAACQPWSSTLLGSCCSMAKHAGVDRARIRLVDSAVDEVRSRSRTRGRLRSERLDSADDPLNHTGF
jgi:hypothetical protein